MGISELGRESAQEAQEQSSGVEEYEVYSVADHDWTRNHPTTAVAGEPVALRVFDSPEDDQQYGGLVLENPRVIADDEDTEGTKIIRSTSERGDDYKVVNEDDEATRLMDDGGETIALFDGNDFEGEVVDEFDTENRLVLKVGGSTMRQVLKRLDANGDQSADVQRDDDGEIVLSDNGYPLQNRGLIEFDDVSDDFNWQIARDPVLRDDVQDGEVMVMTQRKKDVYDDYDGRAYFTTVAAENEDGEFETLDTVENPEEIPVGNLVETGWLEWSYEAAMDEVEGGSGNSKTTTASSSLTASEVEAIDKIEADLAESEETALSELDRGDVESVVAGNSGLFEPETEMEVVVDELVSRV